MEDFSKYIYLAFIIISVLAGLFKNKGKKAERHSQPQPDTQPQSEPLEVRELEAILRRQANQQAEAKKRLEEMERQARMAALESASHRNAETSGLKKAKKQATKSTMEEDHVSETYRDFDPAKAVIYSEILNPKYI